MQISVLVIYDCSVYSAYIYMFTMRLQNIMLCNIYITLYICIYDIIMAVCELCMPYICVYIFVCVGVVVSVCMCARIYLFTNGGPMMYYMCVHTVFINRKVIWLNTYINRISRDM